MAPEKQSLLHILNSFPSLGIDDAIVDQIANANIGAIKLTGFGAIIDLTTSSLRGKEPAPPQSGIVSVINAGAAAVGEAILHLANGKIDYLEIQFYGDERWDCIGTARLT